MEAEVVDVGAEAVDVRRLVEPLGAPDHPADVRAASGAPLP